MHQRHGTTHCAHHIQMRAGQRSIFGGKSCAFERNGAAETNSKCDRSAPTVGIGIGNQHQAIRARQREGDTQHGRIDMVAIADQSSGEPRLIKGRSDHSGRPRLHLRHGIEEMRDPAQALVTCALIIGSSASVWPAQIRKPQRVRSAMKPQAPHSGARVAIEWPKLPNRRK